MAEGSLVEIIEKALQDNGRTPVEVTNCLIIGRPQTIEEAERWIAENAGRAQASMIGTQIPDAWLEGKEYMWGTEEMEFVPGEVVVLTRSDGTVKFGMYREYNEENNAHKILVDVPPEDATTEPAKFLAKNFVGKIILGQ